MSDRAAGAHEVVVCAIVRDEERYVDEWIQYHLKLGFDAVHLYDNSPGFGAKALEVAYPGRVFVRHFPGAVMQMRAYADFLSTARASWCALIDVDEFIVLKRHRSIAEFVAGVPASVGAVCLNWVLFGSSGETGYRPEPVLQRFQRRQAGVDPHVKSLVRPGCVWSLWNPHRPMLAHGTCVDTSGAPVDGPLHPDGPSDVAVVHHYFTKSAEEFRAKVARGRADEQGRRDAGEFARHDLNDVHDSSAWDFFVSTSS